MIDCFFQRLENERRENLVQLLNADLQQLITNADEFVCPICFDSISPGDGIILRECLHTFCKLADVFSVVQTVMRMIFFSILDY